MDNKAYILTPTEKEKKSDEIDLIKLFINIWNKRKFVMITIVLFTLLGLFVALSSPISYISTCTVVPQTGNRRSSSLGGLASIMGVNISSSITDETLSPYVYPQIINSVPFCKEILETNIIVEKSNGKPITLYEYYTDKQYSDTNVLGVVIKYTIGLPRVIISALRSDSESLDVASNSITGEVIRLTNKERRVIDAFRKNIIFNSDDKEGYIRLGYSFSEPEPTAIIAQNMFSTLEKYVKSYKSQKQQDNLVFVEKSYESARKDFIEKQTDLASFQDANRGLTSAMARTTERSLTNEYQVAYTVYNELAVQLEQAKIAVNESTPILTMIDPVVIPNKKSAPNRPVLLFLFIFTGFVFSISWVLLKPFFQKIVSGIKNKAEEN